MGQDQSKKREEQIKEYQGNVTSTEHFPISGEDLSKIVGKEDDTVYQQNGKAKGILEKLSVDPTKGLDGSDFAKRQNQFGYNKYPDPVMKSFLEMFLDSLKDETLIILMISAVVSLLLAIVVPHSNKCGEDEINTEWIEGSAILIAVAVVSFGSTISDYNKQKKFIALSEDEKDVTVTVVRSGEVQRVSCRTLVVGDIVRLDVGDVLQADGIYLSGNDLRLDQSDMTGESVAVRKSESQYRMMSGTKVTDGNGMMVVTSVGVNSMWGKTQMSASSNKERPTPLQDALDVLANQIGFVGMVCAAIVFVVLMIYFVVDIINFEPVRVCDNNPCKEWTEQDELTHTCEIVGFSWSHLTVIVEYIIVAVTIIVVAVPEGLPLAVTISLAYSMQQMMADNNLVRHLKACEIMSNCSNICTDKTGTLTENRMTVKRGWFGGEKMDNKKAVSLKGTKLGEEIFNNISCNKSPSSSVSKDANGMLKTIGNKTECALLGFCIEQEVEYQEIFNQLSASIYQQFAFSSQNKKMSTMLFKENQKKDIHMYLKGAPEVILRQCTKYMKMDGSVVPLDDNKRKELSDFQLECANDGMRTLTLAMRDLTVKNESNLDEKYEKSPDEDCTLLCVFGIEDPLRPEVADAVNTCIEAGITVRMVTGDNIATGTSIAKGCHIVTADDDICIEGPEFAKKSDEEIIAMLPKLKVIARCSPQDKERLVKLLIEQGEVVAVTGDGTNDVPALKAADVGLAMGVRGTDIAKQASDIVILDDNFNSIVKAVMWGRCVYDNIRKFLQFQLTVNVVALAISVIGAITRMGSPLNALQMLWVNMIMDTLAALALGTEKPTASLLKRKPFGRKASLISSVMWRNILVQAAYQLFVLMFLLYLGRYIPLLNAPCAYVKHGEYGTYKCADGQMHSVSDIEKDTTEVQTMIFNTFVFCQIFNEINSRKVNGETNVFEGIFTNYMFVGIMAFISIVQTVIVVFAGPVFGITPFPGIGLSQWIGCLILAGFSLVIGQLAIRFIPANAVQPMIDFLYNLKVKVFGEATEEDDDEKKEKED